MQLLSPKVLVAILSMSHPLIEYTPVTCAWAIAQHISYGPIVQASVWICNRLLTAPWGRGAGGALACLCAFDLVRIHQPGFDQDDPFSSRCLHFFSGQESMLLSLRTQTGQC